jgi:hypothetical protein
MRNYSQYELAHILVVVYTSDVLLTETTQLHLKHKHLDQFRSVGS